MAGAKKVSDSTATGADPAWAFRQVTPGVRRDPFEDEFFTGDDRSDRTDFLVREAVQNALDARDPLAGTPVTVRFAVRTGPAALPATRAAQFLAGLVPHLNAQRDESLHIGTPVPAMPYIAYEDFGTRGLRGDPHLDSDPDASGGPPQDFYWFWRNVGRSGKAGSDRGRWGLGKTVFPSSSRIHAHFGLTVRDDPVARQLLMGQAVTRIHKLDGVEYQPEGYFCRPPAGGTVDLPVDDQAFIKEFADAFGLIRGDRPGLSIVMPYCHEDVRADDVALSVIVHWFFPILRGELKVEVSGTDGDKVIISASTVRDVSAKMEWKGNRTDKKHTPPPFDLASWAITQQVDGGLSELRLAGISKVPEWSEDLFQPKQLDDLRQRLSDGQRLAVRVPLTVERKDGTKNETHFDVFLERDADLTRGEDHFVREGMTVSRISTLASHRGFRGLVVVAHDELSALLGDAEGPAHEDWKRSERRPDRRYVRWPSRLTFVKQSLTKLVGYLTPPPASLDVDLLADLFNVADARRRGPKRKGASPKPVGGDTGNRPPPEIKSTPKWWRVTQTPGGFRLRRSGNVAPPELPRRLRVAVAYDLPDGNPVHNWSRFDFVFDDGPANPVTFKVTGAVVAKLGDNRFDVEVRLPDFVVEVGGFDTVRDVFVRTSELDADGADAIDDGTAVDPVGSDAAAGVSPVGGAN